MEQLRLERSSETIQCHPPATGRELPQQRDGNSSWPHKCACWRASRVVGINSIYFNAFLLLCNHGGASWGCSSEESHTAPQDRVLAKPKFYILFPETEKHVEAPQFFTNVGLQAKINVTTGGSLACVMKAAAQAPRTHRHQHRSGPKYSALPI